MTSQIRKIRKLLHVSTTEIALRLGVAQSSVVRLEQSEDNGTISLNKLREAALAMECELKYELIPKIEISREKSYLGLKRTSRIPLSSRQGALGALLNFEMLEAASKMNEKERILQAIQLSNFTHSL